MVQLKYCSVKRTWNIKFFLETFLKEVRINIFDMRFLTMFIQSNSQFARNWIFDKHETNVIDANVRFSRFSGKTTRRGQALAVTRACDNSSPLVNQLGVNTWIWQPVSRNILSTLSLFLPFAGSQWLFGIMKALDKLTVFVRGSTGSRHTRATLYLVITRDSPVWLGAACLIKKNSLTPVYLACGILA